MASNSVYTPVGIKNIFFVTDFSPVSRLAMPYAIALASRYKSKVTLVHALGAVPFTPIPYEQVPPLEQRPRELVLPQMEALKKECIANGLEVHIALKDGDLSDVLDSELLKSDSELVVLGTHAHGGFHRVLMGSHAEHIARHSRCGVLMVGPNATGAARWRDRIARILIATNFEKGSHHALDYIVPIATEQRSEVTVLHVVDELVGVPLDAAELEEHASKQRLLDLVGHTQLASLPRIEVRLGHPHQEIISLANSLEPDLIVLGRRKGGFFAEHKPSTTLALVTAQARCPVLTLS